MGVGKWGLIEDFFFTFLLAEVFQIISHYFFLLDKPPAPVREQNDCYRIDHIKWWLAFKTKVATATIYNSWFFFFLLKKHSIFRREKKQLHYSYCWVSLVSEVFFFPFKLKIQLKGLLGFSACLLSWSNKTLSRCSSEIFIFSKTYIIYMMNKPPWTGFVSCVSQKSWFTNYYNWIHRTVIQNRITEWRILRSLDITIDPQYLTLKNFDWTLEIPGWGPLIDDHVKKLCFQGWGHAFKGRRELFMSRQD